MIRSISLSIALIAVLLQGCATPNAGEQSKPVVVEGQKPVTAEPPVAVPSVVPKSNEGYSGTPTAPPSATVEPPKVTAEQLLQEGTALYDKGDYRGAVRKLTSAKDSADEGSGVKKSSLRLLAFSYCVSNQRVLCKQQFTSLLAIDPSFELTRGEAGHPLWGPVFREAKAATTPKKK
jgi:hypothetical protein